MSTRIRRNNINKIKSDLQKLVRDGERLLKDEGDAISLKGESLRDELMETLGSAKEYCGDLEDKTIDQLDTMDKSIHKSPYPFLGAACGLGVIVGLLLGKSGYDR